MDESHRYRASAGVRAINELKPVLGLELTATPFVETSKEPAFFKNVIYDYPLGKAMEDGFVKEPAVVPRKGFNPAGMSPDEIERLKLEDGVRLHESVKVELETYARESSNPIVKPFLLVIARDTTHAGQLLALIQSDAFFEGRYKDKVIQVDSSKTGAEEDEMVERLLKVEHTEEPTEIVIHVNMLKEGWDVTNLYTIVPLRAAKARTLIEQSIGRGLRLPYGRRTGVAAVDRLNIVAHDRFQEIVDEARRPDSSIRLQTLVLDGNQLAAKSATLVVPSRLDAMLGFQPEQSSAGTILVKPSEPPLFSNKEDQAVAQLARKAISRLADHPENLPSASWLERPEIRASLAVEIEAQYRPVQMALDGVGVRPDIAAVVTKVAETVARQTIDIPRILVVPKSEVKSGFKPFSLKLDGLKYPPVAEQLWAQYLRTNEGETLAVGKGGIDEERLENYVVAGLVDFDDVCYDDHADLLYDLAAQVVRHLKSYLSEKDTGKVLQCHQREIARFVHAQILDHAWEDAVDYEVKISKGFTELRQGAYNVIVGEPNMDFHQSPPDKSNMAKYVFGGFSRCLYDAQKFQSDAERRLAVILDRDALRWFKPLKGQFQIFYRANHLDHEYIPDFVAETEDVIHMIEVKAASELEAPEVLLKKEVAAR
jgi:type III restriction enzyme